MESAHERAHQPTCLGSGHLLVGRFKRPHRAPGVGDQLTPFLGDLLPLVEDGQRHGMPADIKADLTLHLEDPLSRHARPRAHRIQPYVNRHLAPN